MNHPDFPAWREWLGNLPAGVPMTVGDYILTGANSTATVIQGQLQSDRMIQPFQKPALIDGIRFRAEPSAAGITVFNYDNDLITSFMARVWVGLFSLTNDFVSVPALAVREQYAAGEVVNNGPVAAPFGTYLTGVTSGLLGTQYTWYFREPVYVPAGVPVRINLKRFFNTTQDSGTDGTFAPTTSAAVFGRYFTEDIAPPPGPVPIPYGATYLDPTVPRSATDIAPGIVTQIVSAQTDLCNQTGGTLFLDKMIGRLPMRQNNTAGSILCGDYAGPEPTIRITRTYSAGRDAFSRANNRSIVDPLRPFNSVFAPHSRALDMTGVEMPPGSAFIATIFKATRGAPAAIPFATPINLRVYPALGLLGARMERWS